MTADSIAKITNHTQSAAKGASTQRHLQAILSAIVDESIGATSPPDLAFDIKPHTHI